MRPRSVSILVVALFGLTVSVAASCAEDRGILGFWESVETSEGGIGTALDLQDAGRLRQSVVVLVESAYRLEGGRVLMDDDSTAEELIWTVTEPDTMELSVPGAGVMRKRRFQDPSNGRWRLVGDWTADPPGKLQAFERYTEDGRMLLRLPMKTDLGTYRLDGDRLQVEMEGRSQEWTWRLDGEELVVGSPGEEQRFRRVPEGAWYLPPGT
jgi:hypothetical protein